MRFSSAPGTTSGRNEPFNTRWLEANQPCVFGRVASKNKFVFVCLLEEGEVLRPDGLFTSAQLDESMHVLNAVRATAVAA